MSKEYVVNDFKEILDGRKSIRVYDENVKISREEMENILKDTTRAPSSVNMQPWRFVVVESDEGKEKLRPLIRFNESQNDTSSAMIIIFGDLNSIDKAEKILRGSEECGLISEKDMEKRLERYMDYYKNMTLDKNIETILIDGGIVAMNLMTVAKAYGYDTNAIGGFERDKIARAFDLDEDTYYPVVIISIGKANEEAKRSYRLPVSDVTIWR